MLPDEHMILHRVVNGEDPVRKGRADSFLKEKNPERYCFFSTFELRCKCVRHRIVDVEDDLGPHEFRQQGAEHEEIGHVVYMHYAVALLELQPRRFEQASEEEFEI